MKPTNEPFADSARRSGYDDNFVSNHHIAITVRPRIWPARIFSPSSNILVSGST
jgi:hypothetical protein